MKNSKKFSLKNPQESDFSHIIWSKLSWRYVLLVCSSTIRDKIIPHAVSWFTGEAVQGDELEDIEDDDDEEDDDDDENEDDEDEDDDDGEDEDEDEDEDEEEDEGKSKKKVKDLKFALLPSV